MTRLPLRPGLVTLIAVAGSFLFFFAPSASAASFTVHGYELGERIRLQDGGRVWTAELDVTLDEKKGSSFCVDLMTHIGVGHYTTRSVLNPYTGASPADEHPRDFAWAGYVMDTYGKDLSLLMHGGVSKTQAITGVQAAIWEGIYAGPVVQRESLSDGARSVFDQIMNTAFDPGMMGNALVVELQGNQDQVFSNPVPEPAAAMVFGMGMLIVSQAVRRKR